MPKHYITLTFDDGFEKSCLKTAEVYEGHGYLASFNIIAMGHDPHVMRTDQPSLMGDWTLWNQLRDRGHEILPHGYDHSNKAEISFEDAKTSIEKCLHEFRANLKGFDAASTLFSFPYMISTAEIETWLGARVRAYRTGGPCLMEVADIEPPHLTSASFGPDNCEAQCDERVEALLATETDAWLYLTLHGLDEEGWGPIRRSYLDDLLARLSREPSVRVLPALRVLDEIACSS